MPLRPNLRFIPILCLIALIFVLESCKESKYNPHLLSVMQLVSENPQAALDSLELIPYEGLGVSDRHLYDFLSIKANDKLYIVQPSDSLILEVISYASNHKKDFPYAESLYYGARVYTDLGDYPSALKYFQNALDALEQEEGGRDNLQLKGHILSQTGRLLNILGLPSHAQNYIKQTLELDSLLKDSLNYMYDTELLGSIILTEGNLNIADRLFRQAKNLATVVSPEDVPTLDMHIASCKEEAGELDSALIYIRSALKCIDPLVRDEALAHAASIYLENNILDTAYMYANDLFSRSDSYNKCFGFQIALTTQLKDFIPKDSLYNYITNYANQTNDLLSKNSSQAALIQNSFYNYQLHERNYLKEYNKNQKLIIIISATIGLILILIIILLILKSKNNKDLIKLHEANERILILQNSLSLKQAERHKEESQIEEKQLNIGTDKPLEEKLSDELSRLTHMCAIPHKVSSIILQSHAYEELKTYIANEKMIVEKNKLWKDLEEVVNEGCKKFQYNLNLLRRDKINDNDYHLILLIKCGVTPTEMTYLMGKTKGSISYQREKIGLKLLGLKLRVSEVDDIIFSL